MDHIVGIDLGTTNSEIAIIRNGRPEVIPVDGEIIMPSCVGIDNKGDLIVGRRAKNQMVVNPESTILSIKRKMGQNISVQLGDGQFTPEEISSLILKKLKREAEEYLGEDVRKAVITVPAYFDDSQRKATKNAGILAGLEVMRIINEPTAASLAYDAEHEENQNILVYDLGGGTFDVSLVIVENGVVEVKASHGDTHLGGNDFDNLLIDHVAETFKEQHGIDLLSDVRSRNRVWSTVERAKRELSDHPFALIKEEFIRGDHHLDMEISRVEYEDMIRPLVQKTIECVHLCLKDACFLPGAIDRIILVGGATRTPLVSEMLQQKLKIEPRHEINPDLIVSMGAAIQGGIFSGLKTDSVLVDITPYTFGTSAVALYRGELRPNVFVPIIKRNSALPVSKGEVFVTFFDNQEEVDVRIYQGENELVEDDIFIGNFLVEGLDKVPRGNQIVLNVQLDLNGILEVTAIEKCTGLSKSVRMETGEDGNIFNLDQAQKNIAPFLGDEVDELRGISAHGREKEDIIADAKGFRMRAEALLDIIDETDASEIRSIIDDSIKAVREGSLDKLSELNESLSDMLFYLED